MSFFDQSLPQELSQNFQINSSDPSLSIEQQKITLGFKFSQVEIPQIYHTAPVSFHQPVDLKNNLTCQVKKQQNQAKDFCSKKVKNQTKNIPKNYGKAIINFIQTNRQRCQPLLLKINYDYDQLLANLITKKKSINTIRQLRALWLQSQFTFAKPMRILSNLFLRNYSLEYIFNSRITTFSSHIKYRHKLLQALKNPKKFNNIKDY